MADEAATFGPMARAGIPAMQVLRQVDAHRPVSLCRARLSRPAVALATDHLLRPGARHIAFVGGVAGRAVTAGADVGLSGGAGRRGPACRCCCPAGPPAPSGARRRTGLCDCASRGGRRDLLQRSGGAWACCPALPSSAARSAAISGWSVSTTSKTARRSSRRCPRSAATSPGSAQEWPASLLDWLESGTRPAAGTAHAG